VNTIPDLLSLGDVARVLGCQLWQVGRIFDRGYLPQPPKIGKNRVVTREYLPEIKEALVKAGFLKK
jgi:hypothetical protein